MDYNALKDISYGMYVLTTSINGEHAGCIINSAIQITSSTSVIAISVNKNNYTNKVLRQTKKFALSILSQNTPTDVIGTFGFKSSKEYNKFETFNVKLIDNLPIIDENITSYLICDVNNIISVDTHDIFLAKIVNCKKLNDLQPLTYEYYQKVIKGSSPQNAPTYIPSPTKQSDGDIYECLICKFQYNENDESLSFKELPKDWVCPICGAPKEVFKKV